MGRPRSVFGAPKGCIWGSQGVYLGLPSGVFGAPKWCIWGYMGIPSGAYGLPTGVPNRSSAALSAGAHLARRGLLERSERGGGGSEMRTTAHGAAGVRGDGARRARLCSVLGAVLGPLPRRAKAAELGAACCGAAAPLHADETQAAAVRHAERRLPELAAEGGDQAASGLRAARPQARAERAFHRRPRHCNQQRHNRTQENPK